jgi:hypothetical protein
LALLVAALDAAGITAVTAIAIPATAIKRRLARQFVMAVTIAASPLGVRRSDGLLNRAPCPDRTDDLPLTRRLLYH